MARRRVVRLLIAALSAVAAAALGLSRTGAWDASDDVVVALVVLVAVVAVASTAWQVVVEERADARAAEAERAAFVVRSTVLTLAEQCEVPVRDLGLSLWVPGRRRLVVAGERRLRRVHRERLAFGPPPSSVAWTAGKGVVGECLRTGAAVQQDVAADWQRWADVEAARWDDVVPEAVRKGLDRAELALAARYALVRAVPGGPGRRARAGGGGAGTRRAGRRHRGRGGRGRAGRRAPGACRGEAGQPGHNLSRRPEEERMAGEATGARRSRQTDRAQPRRRVLLTAREADERLAAQMRRLGVPERVILRSEGRAATA